MSTLAYSPRDFIKEICQEEGIHFESLSQDYIARLTKGDATRHVLWSNWDINHAAADRVACDKCACYTVLDHCDVQAIPHHLLKHPFRRQGWTGEKGTWTQALGYFDSYNQKVVLKPNLGTNGQNIYYCDTLQTLEAAAHAIFETSPDIALSPFYKIKTEYRVFYVNDDCPLVYGKQPSDDNWRHNLSQGATAFELVDEDKLNKLKALAVRAAKAISINFATIDITELENGELAIMEINSGVQARQLLEQKPHLYPVVKDIYAAAIQGMFAKTY